MTSIPFVIGVATVIVLGLSVHSWLLAGALSGAAVGFLLITFSSARNMDGSPNRTGNIIILIVAFLMFILSIIMGPLAFVLTLINYKRKVGNG